MGVSVRTTSRQRLLWEKASRRLGISLSSFVKSTLDVVAGRIYSEGWECRRIYLKGNQIISMGEARPMTASGLPLPMPGFLVVAPTAFWRHMDKVGIDEASVDKIRAGSRSTTLEG